jgi:hypothetical protein
VSTGEGNRPELNTPCRGGWSSENRQNVTHRKYFQVFSSDFADNYDALAHN